MQYNRIHNVSNLNTLMMYTIKQTDSDYAINYLEGGEKFCYIKFITFFSRPPKNFYILLKKFKNENNQN